MVYPGKRNQRIRWEGEPPTEEIASKDLETARTSGKKDFAEVIKEAKDQMKSPLADKDPIFSLHINKFAMEGEDTVSVIDEKGAKIPLKLDILFGSLLRNVSREQAEGNTLICRFDQDLETDILWGIPIALITHESVIRFMY
jgi:hypothetical protein